LVALSRFATCEASKVLACRTRPNSVYSLNISTKSSRRDYWSCDVVIAQALTIKSRACRISFLASFEAWFWYWWFWWFWCSLSIRELELGRFSPFWMRLRRAALAELGWGKGAARGSEDSGSLDRTKVNGVFGTLGASGVLVGRSSSSLGLSGSSPMSSGSM